MTILKSGHTKIQRKDSEEICPAKNHRNRLSLAAKRTKSVGESGWRGPIVAGASLNVVTNQTMPREVRQPWMAYFPEANAQKGLEGKEGRRQRKLSGRG